MKKRPLGPKPPKKGASPFSRNRHRSGRPAEGDRQTVQTRHQSRDQLRPPSGDNASGELRIIAGTLKGRKVSFPPVPGLRPTGDRIRETLFNWLQSILPGACCLDLFAGSGILGLEALSRGAKEVTFVDQNHAVCQKIMGHVVSFGMEKSAKIFSSSAIDFLNHRHSNNLFDVVFLDPPFESDLIAICAQYLEQRQLLAKTAYIYLETDRKLIYPPIPSGWKLVQSQNAGQVAFHLAKRN